MALPACGAGAIRVTSLDAVERARQTQVVRESATSAPVVYAEAERERSLAIAAHAAHDELGAQLHAEHALAAYQHAVVVGRLERASKELEDARRARDDESTAARGLDDERARLDHEAADLEGRAAAARERMMPARTAAAALEREAARWRAAQSLAMEARLLCGAARLLHPEADGLASASDGAASVASDLERGMPRPPPASSEPAPSAGVPTATVAPSASAPAPALAPIDRAARARARCLEVLTSVRAPAIDGIAAADSLLSELSAAGWEPVRDERGVVVTLRGAFRGGELTPEAAARVQDLGRVAAAHASFPVQIVVHDASRPTPSETAVDHARADAATQALATSGGAQLRASSELAGARLPIADPSDPRARGRNERLDVVFVAP